jgi:uncharacterized membrane protein YidH (DUF202 family)
MTEPGRAPERTALAWTRTLLAGTVVAVLTARLALHTGLTPWWVAGTLAAGAIWLLLAALARWRVQALSRQPVPVARREPALLATIVLGFTVLAIALVLLS